MIYCCCFFEASAVKYSIRDDFSSWGLRGAQHPSVTYSADAHKSYRSAGALPMSMMYPGHLTANAEAKKICVMWERDGKGGRRRTTENLKFQILASTLMAHRPIARTALRTKSTSTSVAYSLSSARTCRENASTWAPGVTAREYPPLTSDSTCVPEHEPNVFFGS